jgi:hypothetical protein
MGLDKVADAFNAANVLTLAADGMFDDTSELRRNIGVFTMFAPNADDEGVFCHGFLLLVITAVTHIKLQKTTVTHELF